MLGPLLRQVLEGVDGAGWRGGGTAASAAPSSFPFYFVVSCMFVAFLYYPLVFVPVWSRSNPGYLWDKTSLHVFSLLTQLVMWTSFYLVWKKDPGVVGRNENAPELGGGGPCGVGDLACGAAGRVRRAAAGGGNPHCPVRTAMDSLTRSLRRRYDQALEEMAAAAEGKGPANPDIPPLCHSCRIARPLRSKHCRVTRRCVLVFDHHCPFVGATIGLYNYKYFYAFLLSLTVALLCFIYTLVLHTIRVPKASPGVLIVGMFLSIIVVPVAVMLFYHTQLTYKNLTTNEHQNMHRYKYLQRDNLLEERWDKFAATSPAHRPARSFHNPFNRGFISNALSRLLPGEESYVIFEENIGACKKGDTCCGNVPDMDVEMVATPNGKAGRRSAARKRADEEKDLLANAV